MLKKKHTRVFTRLLRKFLKSQKILLQAFHSFLRSFFVGSRRQRRQRQAGFVLPTTVLVLLIVSILVAALMFRSISRTNQAIGERQQQVIYNAATPAIDRAKAKLEYLFTRDPGYPSGGVPPENTLIQLLQNDGNTPSYTLPGETRLDLNGDTIADNAWVYQDPASQNTIAYSILAATQGKLKNGKNVDNTSIEQDKAAAMVVRNGPMSSVQLSSNCLNAG